MYYYLTNYNYYKINRYIIFKLNILYKNNKTNYINTKIKNNMLKFQSRPHFKHIKLNIEHNL